MRYLLDTNTCIRYLNGRAPNIRMKVLSVSSDDIAVSTITMAEMFYGSAKSQTPDISRARQQRFFDRFAQVHFDASAAIHYGVMRAVLEKSGTPIGQLDMLIAATARANDLILVTHNIREFQRVTDLTIEDWE